jgi:hypothetical protein
MPNFARITPSRRFGLNTDPEEGWFAPTVAMLGSTIGWGTGAPLSYGTTGTQTTPVTGTVAGMLAEGGYASAAIPVSPAVSFLGFASEPYTATGSFTTPPGTEQLPAVAAGTTINGIRRRFYPVGPQIKFVGTLDTAGNISATALSLADVGSYFCLRPINNTTAAAGNGLLTLPNSTIAAANVVWILDRTTGATLSPSLSTTPTSAAGAGGCCLVTKLIDPPGAKTTDTPVAGVNSGQSLVEFVVVPLTGVVATTLILGGPQF